MLNYIRNKFSAIDAHRFVEALPISESRKIMMHRNLVHARYSEEYLMAKAGKPDHDLLQYIDSEWARAIEGLDEREASLITRRLFKQASRLRIATPSRTETNDLGIRLYWVDIDDGEDEALNDVGIRRLTEDIRSELKWRRESRNHRIGYIGVITGAIGASAALATVLHDIAKKDDPPACVISVDSRGVTSMMPPPKRK